MVKPVAHPALGVGFTAYAIPTIVGEVKR
ncbi:hypothetical protein [Micromonospora sp. DT47]